MAKSQKHASREPKKPKTSKKKHDTPAYLLAEQASAPKIITPQASTAKH
jgi:hypothetical protein